MRSAAATSGPQGTRESVFHSLKRRFNPPPCRLELQAGGCRRFLPTAGFSAGTSSPLLLLLLLLECCGIGPRSSVDVLELSKSHSKRSVLKWKGGLQNPGKQNPFARVGFVVQGSHLKNDHIFRRRTRGSRQQKCFYHLWCQQNSPLE